MAPVKRPAKVDIVSQNEEEPDEDYLNKRARNNDAVKILVFKLKRFSRNSYAV